MTPLRSNGSFSHPVGHEHNLVLPQIIHSCDVRFPAIPKRIQHQHHPSSILVAHFARFAILQGARRECQGRMGQRAAQDQGRRDCTYHLLARARVRRAMCSFTSWPGKSELRIRQTCSAVGYRLTRDRPLTQVIYLTSE